MIGDCANCCYEGVEVSTYRDGCPAADYTLCTVCANTLLSKAIISPRQCSDVSLYRSLAWIANAILEAVKK